MRVDVQRGAQLVPSTRSEIARFRHRVFVEKLGWHVQASSACPRPTEGEESDEYDHDDTVYVTLRGREDAIVGCARLLPAKNRYLLGDHFRHLVDDLRAAVDVGDAVEATNASAGAKYGCASHVVDTPVWELSRFAWDQPEPNMPRGAGREASHGAHELLRAAVFTARALGARRLIGVTFVSLARLFVRIGVPTHKLGAAYRIDGRWVAAYRIDIDAQTLTALGLAGAAPQVSHTAPWGAPCDESEVILPAPATASECVSPT